MENVCITSKGSNVFQKRHFSDKKKKNLTYLLNLEMCPFKNVYKVTIISF